MESWALASHGSRENATGFQDLEDYVSDYLSKVIEAEKPDLIALSLLSFHSHGPGAFVMRELKRLCDTPIIIGGPGVTVPMGEVDFRPENEVVYGQKCLEEGLCDFFISGEGEKSFLEFLNGGCPSGLNSARYTQLQSFEGIPFPSYRHWTEKYPDMEIIPYITGSKGCVRTCNFCDVSKIWPKFIARKAENIYEEMKFHQEQIGATRFEFTDSLINGSLPAFKELLGLLARHNRNHPDSRIEWNAQTIVRSSRVMSSELYDLIAESGCKTVYIGIESGSERVRKHMGKHFTQDDLYHDLENLLGRGIHVVGLQMIGYPTEHESDFLLTKQLAEKFSHYHQNFQLSYALCQVNRGTKLYDVPEAQWQDSDGAENSETDWFSAMAGDHKNRLRRWVDIHQHTLSLGYTYDNFTRVRVRKFLMQISKDPEYRELKDRLKQIRFDR